MRPTYSVVSSPVSSPVFYPHATAPPSIPCSAGRIDSINTYGGAAGAERQEREERRGEERERERVERREREHKRERE